MKEPSKVVGRGLVAGFVGATILALWFFVIDAIQGQPFHTPAFMASVLFDVDGVDRSFGLLAIYTAIHYAAFFAVGVVVAWIMSKLDTAPSVLLGIALGFLLFDVVFYGGVMVTGVDVVDRLGWPEVLFGNLLAGISLMGYLHLTTDVPSVTWWEVLREHRIVREGIVAGLVGAVSVAVWFLVFDMIRREVFFTPGALGSALFYRVSDLSRVEVSAVTVGGYTVVHVVAFVVAGFVAAAIATEAENRPPLVLGAVLLFAAFEAFFMGLLALAAEWLLGALAWWSIAVGNLLATVTMAWYLWKAHPDLQEALRNHPLDQTR